jgi:hypothetical protein
MFCIHPLVRVVVLFSLSSMYSGFSCFCGNNCAQALLYLKLVVYCHLVSSYRHGGLLALDDASIRYYILAE